MAKAAEGNVTNADLAKKYSEAAEALANADFQLRRDGSGPGIIVEP